MTEKDVQWLTYHFNIENMFHVALKQLQDIDDKISLVVIYIFNSY